MTTQTSVSSRLSLNQTDSDLFRDFLNKQYLPALRYDVAGGPVSVCLSVFVSVTSRSSVETDERIELVFLHGSILPPIVHSVKRKFGYLQKQGYFPRNSFLNSVLGKFVSCYRISSTKVDVHSVINWTVIGQLS